MYTVCTDTKMYIITDSTVYALTHNCTTSLYVQCMHWHNPIHHHSKYNVCTDNVLYVINTYLNCLNWHNTVHSTFIVCTDTILYTSTLRKLYALTQYRTPSLNVYCMHWQCRTSLYVHWMHWYSSVQHQSMYTVCIDTVLYTITLYMLYALTQYSTRSPNVHYWTDTIP